VGRALTPIYSEEISMTNIFISSVIDAPVSKVWSRIRDFNALPEWHPAIANSTIENGEPSDRVGCIRNFNLKDGGNLRERLLALSDLDYSFTYSILESPMPVRNYTATVSLFPVTDGDPPSAALHSRTYARWTAEFNCDPEDEAAVVKLIGEGVFLAGFRALQTILGRS
jgi:uncharacterized protein YndB with AHSA1/START domain